MSRWGIDPSDDDAYDVKYDGTDCADCGGPSVEWLCETCSDQRDAHTSALERRLAMHMMQERPALMHHSPVVDVALVPVFTNGYNPAVVEVALVPTGSVRVLSAQDARELKRMARAFLSADLSNVREVA
jgi:hypothetical protein